MVDRTQQDPFAHIFRVLDAAKVKDRLTLKPGQHLLAGALPAPLDVHTPPGLPMRACGSPPLPVHSCDSALHACET